MKTRKIKCVTCGKYWVEPARPGARPWECPECNPEAARRREAERERAGHKRMTQVLDDRPKTVEVPDFLRPILNDLLDHVSDFPQPGREDLARQVRAVAYAQGHVALRHELMQLSALCVAWSAWLPATDSLPRADVA